MFSSESKNGKVIINVPYMLKTAQLVLNSERILNYG